MKAKKAKKGDADQIGTVITVSIFLMIAFTSLAFGAVEPWSTAVFNLATLALLILWAVKSAVDGRLSFRLPAAAWPLIAVIVYGIWQSLLFTDKSGRRFSISMDTEATRMALEVSLFLLISLLVAVNIIITQERISWLRNFLIFYGLALAVFGLVQHFTWNGRYYWVFEPSISPSAPFGPFVNHNHFAGYLEMIVPIPVALVLTRTVRGEIGLLYGFSAVIMGVATIVSLSRGGMISMISGLLFVVVFGLRPSMIRRERARKENFPLFLSRAAAAVVIIFTIGAGVLWVGADSVIKRVEKTNITNETRSSDPGKETFYQSRGRVWSDTMALIRDNWAMGVGLGAYQTVFPIYNGRDGSLIVGQAHNDYLQVVADCGLIGAIAALSFIVIVMRDIFRALRHQDRSMAALALGCGGGVFAMLVHSLFDFNLQLPSNALLFLVLVAVISNVSRATIKSTDASQHRVASFKGVARQPEVWS